MLFQVLQGLGGLGQGFFGQLRQRVDEMRRQVQVDAVADARMTHNVDELDVLIDRRPVEQALFHRMPVVGSAVMDEDFVAVERGA